jgi:WD40 repeat protein/tetratricopeptide (TPR) repeat protein
MNEESLFLAALERPTPEARRAFLNEVCGTDAVLLQRLWHLVAAHEKASGVLDRGAAAPACTGAYLGAAPEAAEEPPAGGRLLAGRYKLLEEIGEGGMGTVWMAQQTEPVKRLVAVKLIKAGMDSKGVLARFEAERQALALMDHPHIAKVLDAGTTDTGRPFFVMELVKAVPITRYCDEHRLTPKQRLELFIPVCQAIQHAHQKGIIHRDIKPSNILVTMYDAKPMPKVIDFGVAKAIDQRLTERTLFTQMGQVVGTLEYMSPEQAELNSLDIDTRSDVYALGVLLYELLTGTTPLTRKRVKEAGLLEVLRLVREEEPPRPSARLTTTEELPSIAERRGLAPRPLSRLLRGELDAIVLKCLEKDRDRRYESASALARDLERWLAGEPVRARPVGRPARLGRWCRRNPLLALVSGSAALAALLALGVSIGFALYFAHASEQIRSEGEAKDEANEHLRREKRDTQVRYCTTLLSRGLESCDKGEVDIGLLWLVRGLENAPEDDTDLQRVFRTNLAAWGSQTSRLRALLPSPPGDRTSQVTFTPDGRRLVAATNLQTRRDPDGIYFDRRAEIRVWDAATGQPDGSPCPVGSQVWLAPDGKTALAVSGNATRVWDVARCRPLGKPTPLAQPEIFTSAAFSGETVLMVGSSGALQLWETATGRLIGARPGSRAPYLGLGLSPDGCTVRAVSQVTRIRDGRATYHAAIELWTPATGQVLVRPLAHPESASVVAAAFSPDGRLLLTGSQDDRLRAWDAATGTLLGTSTTQQSDIRRILFSPGGTLVFTAGGQLGVPYIAPSARLWNLSRGDSDVTLFNTTSFPTDGEIACAAFSPDGRTLATGTVRSNSDLRYQRGEAQLWDVATGEPIDRPLPHPSAVSAVAFSPDGRTLLTVADAVRLWEMPRGQLYPLWSTASLDSFTEKLRLPGAPAFLMSSVFSAPLLSWRNHGPEFGRLRSVEDLVISADGKAVLTAFGSTSLGSTVGVLAQDAATGELVGRPFALRKGSAVALRPDGKALVTVTADGAAQVWEAGTWKPIGPGSRQPGKVHGVGTRAIDQVHHVVTTPWVQWGPGDRIILSTHAKGPLPWDPASWQPAGPPLPSRDLPLAVSRDGKLLLRGEQAASGVGEAVQVWDWATGTALGPPLSHRAAVRAAAFSPDGRILVTGSEDQTARLWDVRTGEALGVPLWHRGIVTATAFSPDGRVVLTGSADGTARFWDAATGRPLTAPLRHGPIRYVAFAPDGRTALTITAGGHLCCWPAPPPPLEGTPRRLALWAESLSDRDMNADGVAGWQTDQGWNERRRRLQAADGPPLPGPDVLAWHRHEAGLCTTYGDWYAAAWHLDRLTRAEPKRAAHWIARGKVRASLGQLSGAVGDYTRAIELGEKGREVRLERGRAYAALRRWDRAAADYETAVDLDSPAWVSQEAACLYLLAGRTPAYKALCRHLFLHAEQKKGPTPTSANPVFTLARVCALSSECPVDPGQVAARVEQESQTPQARPLYLLVRLHYRAGRFDQAIQDCKALLQAGGVPVPQAASYWLVLAMAHQRLGQTEEAWQWLDRAVQWRDSPGAVPLLPLSLVDWLEFQVLDREAAALLATAKQCPTLTGHTGTVWQVVLSADGSRLLSAGHDQTVRLWDVTTGKELRCFRGHTGAICGAALSPDGRRVLSGSDDGTIRLWDVADGKGLRRLDQAGGVKSLAFTPDSRRAVFCTCEGLVRLWDVDGWKELRHFTVHDGLWSVTVCPRGRHALVAGGFNTPDGKSHGILRLWDLESGTEVRRFDEARSTGIWRAVFSPDGRQALSASTDAVVRLWDVGTGKELRSFRGQAGKVLSVAFAPDGRLALSGGTDGTVRLWDLSSGRELARRTTPAAGPIRSVACSPDGRYALFGSADGPIRPWLLPKAEPKEPPKQEEK